MAPTLAYVTPEVLRWARESTGYDVADAADKINVVRWRLEAAEEGADRLTLRQAERAADLYERPLATLFLPSPPVEESPEAVFRSLADAPSLPWPPEMRLLARRIRRRQNAVVELLDLLGDEPAWPATAGRVRGMLAPKLVDVARDLLLGAVEPRDDWRDQYAPLRARIDAVEALGVLVMQDGHMSVDAMRGFASPHPTVPVIVLNTKDDARARAFTIVHEFGHLLGSVIGAQEDERWYDEFAGRVLVPADLLRQVLDAAPRGSTVSRIDFVARRFGVTPLAAAVRVARAGVLPDDEAQAAIGEIR